MGSFNDKTSNKEYQAIEMANRGKKAMDFANQEFQAIEMANRPKNDSLRENQMQQLLNQSTKPMKLNGRRPGLNREDKIKIALIGVAAAIVFVAGMLWARADLKKIQPIMDQGLVGQYNAASKEGESTIESNGVSILAPSDAGNEPETNKSIGGKK